MAPSVIDPLLECCCSCCATCGNSESGWLFTQGYTDTCLPDDQL